MKKLKTTVNPEEVRAAREKTGLTQKQAAALLGYHRRAWQNWESTGDSRRMRRALFDLFKLKAVQSIEEHYRNTLRKLAE